MPGIMRNYILLALSGILVVTPNRAASAPSSADQNHTLSTTLQGFPAMVGSTLYSQGHPNWNIVQSTQPYNPTEWQVYSNAAQGIARVLAGTNEVVRVSGTPFDPSWIGKPYFFWDGSGYFISDIRDSDHLFVRSTGGSSVSWKNTALGTFYYVMTSVENRCDISGNQVSYRSGQPFIPFAGLTTIDGAAVSATFQSPTSLVLNDKRIHPSTGTCSQVADINHELSTLRLQGLAGVNEENFAITFRPDGTYLQSSYAGLGQYRPIWIGSGENPVGTFNPQLGIHPAGTLGKPGWLTLGGDFGHQAILIRSNASNGNYVTVSGAETGSAPILAAEGTDADTDLRLEPKGRGAIVVAGTLKLAKSTFGTLPACDQSSAGSMAFITDAAARITEWRQKVTQGKGTNPAFVSCNGDGFWRASN